MSGEGLSPIARKWMAEELVDLPRFGQRGPERALQDSKSGAVYVIRDVWSGAIACSPLVRCEYAVMEGDTRVWKPCVEGVLFADIAPFVTING